MQTVTFSPISTRYSLANTQQKANNKVSTNTPATSSFMLGATMLANQNIAFMSKKEDSKPRPELPKYDKSLVADEAEGHYSYYLRNNPEEFYNKHGVEINSFLRTGQLATPPDDADEVPAIFRSVVENEINEIKDYNRSLVDSVSVLDGMMNSKTDDVEVVYRCAPTSWLDHQKDGILIDKGFFSTTPNKQIALDSCKGQKGFTCFEVAIPEDTEYLDLTEKKKCVMLFPRSSRFKVLDDHSLEMLKDED